MVDVATVTGIVGALGAGSVIGSYVAGGKDRRLSRAAVLKSIETLELERWGPVTWLDFRLHSIELLSAALVAQLPRELVMEYVVLARTAAELSDDNYRQSPPDDKTANGIDGHVSDMVRDGARLVTAVAWSPRPVALARASFGLRALRSKEAGITAEDFKRHLKSAREVVV